MTLSREQFQELRSRGLSVEQIVEMQERETQKPASEQRKDVKLWDTSGFTSPFVGGAKEVGRTGLGIGTIGRGIQRKLSQGIGALTGIEDFGMGTKSVFDIDSQARQQAEEKLKAEGSGEKIGGFVTGAGIAALPSGAATKATKGLGFARAMLGRGAIAGVTGTIQGGGDIDRDTGLAIAGELAVPVAGKALKYGGNILKNLAGFTTGVGGEVIEEVVSNPRAALAAKGADDIANLKQTSSAIREGVKVLKRNAGDDFARMTADHTEQLSKSDFLKLADDYIDDFRSYDLGIPDSAYSKIDDVIKQHDDYSARGINKLASKISRFYQGTEKAADTDALVSGLNRRIRNWVGEQVPEIAEANAKYADKMDLLEQMDSIFRTKGQLDSRVGIQKTAERVSRLFNANKQIAREGVRELESEIGENVLGREAGRQLMSGVQTKFQAGGGEAAREVLRSVIPPKLVLNIAASTGIAKEAIESRLATLDPAARGAMIEFLTDVYGEGEGQTTSQEQMPPQQ